MVAGLQFLCRTVKDRNGRRRLPEGGMPVLDWEMIGDHGGLLAENNADGRGWFAAVEKSMLDRLLGLKTTVDLDHRDGLIFRTWILL